VLRRRGFDRSANASVVEWVEGWVVSMVGDLGIFVRASRDSRSGWIDNVEVSPGNRKSKIGRHAQEFPEGYSPTSWGVRIRTD
jgi:hypothetical protein